MLHKVLSSVAGDQSPIIVALLSFTIKCTVFHKYFAAPAASAGSARCGQIYLCVYAEAGQEALLA